MSRRRRKPFTTPRKEPETLGRWLFIAAVLFTLGKLWLLRSQPQFVVGNSPIDDELFVNQAWELLHGRWLGGYSETTLAKGPLYPLWIAALRWLHIPLRLGDQLAYAAACALAVRALLPVLRGSASRLAAYLLLLANPMTWEMAMLGRVLRQNIGTPLTLALLACAMALCLRSGRGLRALLPWALGGGLLFAAFWLTREEGLWLAPSLCLLAAWFVASSWIQNRLAGLRPALLSLGSAAAAAAIPLLLVCTLNHAHYGWFGTVEFRAAEFKAAYGALTRAIPEREIPLTPVTRDMREKLYPHSPALAALRPQLDGPAAVSWAGNCTAWTGLPPEEREVAAGWFMWLLREAVVREAGVRNAREALDYYQRIADEVNAACDSGKVPAVAPRSGFLPRWRPGLARDWIASASRALRYFLSFEGFTARTPPSVGHPERIARFREVTGERESTPANTPAPAASALTRNDEARVRFLEGLGQLFRMLLTPLCGACLLAFAARPFFVRRLGLPGATYLFAAAALGGCLSLVLLLALVDATSFPTLNTSSYAQAYPLLLLFAILMLLETRHCLSRLRAPAGEGR